MRGFTYLFLLAFACLTAARSAQHVGKSLPNLASRGKRNPTPQADIVKRASTYLNTNTTSECLPQHYLDSRTEYHGLEFAVNGTGIPDVNFDIGESYAGLLPISNDPNETRQLYFWFFPSTNPAASDEITIWLNGGPGCSSLEGLLQENGPFLWQYGTFAPVRNPYTWVNLTNMIWVEQPVGTGFSQGTPSATSEADVARQFLGFFKNFVETFGLQGRKIYIAGESYAGYYIPYIADAMLNSQDTAHFDVKGILMYDPSTSTDTVQEQSKTPRRSYTQPSELY